MTADLSQTSPESRLSQLGIVLPTVLQPAGNYVRGAITGNLLYLAGHLPDSGGTPHYMGKIGRDLSTADGYQASRIAMINSLGTIKNQLCDLRRVRRFVKLLGMVNSTADFTEHPTVIDGASDLIEQLFGRELALHARSAVGMNSLPRGNSVEIETIVEFV